MGGVNFVIAYLFDGLMKYRTKRTCFSPNYKTIKLTCKYKVRNGHVIISVHDRQTVTLKAVTPKQNSVPTAWGELRTLDTCCHK